MLFIIQTHISYKHCIVFVIDVQIVLKSDVRDSAEESRAFFYDNFTNSLTNTFVRNVTFKRGEMIAFKQKLYFSIEVSFFFFHFCIISNYVDCQRTLIELRG